MMVADGISGFCVPLSPNSDTGKYWVNTARIALFGSQWWLHMLKHCHCLQGLQYSGNGSV
jgi:hypothetical protein